MNISLDSFREDRVDALARRPGTFEKVLAGLEAAEKAGLEPIKINVVLIRGKNDDEILDFAEATRDRPWHVRFIEIMPTASNLDLSAERFLLLPGGAGPPSGAGRAGAGVRPGGERAGHLLPVSRGPGDGGGHHPHEPQLL